jgi:hypothetical protein
MNSGLTKLEQTQYKVAREEAEFHRLLINALRKSQSTFQDCSERFEQYLETLVKLKALHDWDVYIFESRIARYTADSEGSKQ